MLIKDFGYFLGTSKVLDARAKERRLRRINNTPQGEATEGNAADDSLMVDQGMASCLTYKSIIPYTYISNRRFSSVHQLLFGWTLVDTARLQRRMI
jgi:hypothetical protein